MLRHITLSPGKCLSFWPSPLAQMHLHPESHLHLITKCHYIVAAFQCMPLFLATTSGSCSPAQIAPAPCPMAMPMTTTILSLCSADCPFLTVTSCLWPWIAAVPCPRATPMSTVLLSLYLDECPSFLPSCWYLPAQILAVSFARENPYSVAMFWPVLLSAHHCPHILSWRHAGWIQWLTQQQQTHAHGTRPLWLGFAVLTPMAYISHGPGPVPPTVSAPPAYGLHTSCFRCIAAISFFLCCWPFFSVSSSTTASTKNVQQCPTV